MILSGFSFQKLRWLTVGLVLPALVACATYQSKLGGFSASLRRGDGAAAAAEIKEKAFTEGDDQVVYLFEYGTATQIAKDYAESNKAFLKAEDLTEVKDYKGLLGQFSLDDKGNANTGFVAAQIR